MKRALSALALLLTTSACATIVEGTTQTINISTSPQARTSCTLKDTKTTYYATTPGNVSVEKGDGPMHISCRGQGMSGQLTVNEEMEGWMIGNIVAGGIIGGAVDAASGAYQKYPANIVVPLVQ